MIGLPQKINEICNIIELLMTSTCIIKANEKDCITIVKNHNKNLVAYYIDDLWPAFSLFI